MSLPPLLLRTQSIRQHIIDRIEALAALNPFGRGHRPASEPDAATGRMPYLDQVIRAVEGELVHPRVLSGTDHGDLKLRGVDGPLPRA